MHNVVERIYDLNKDCPKIMLFICWLKQTSPFFILFPVLENGQNSTSSGACECPVSAERTRALWVLPGVSTIHSPGDSAMSELEVDERSHTWGGWDVACPRPFEGHSCGAAVRWLKELKNTQGNKKSARGVRVDLLFTVTFHAWVLWQACANLILARSPKLKHYHYYFFFYRGGNW